MSMSKEIRVANKILNPMLRLVSFYEISNYYNFLPGMGEESCDYAWAFYDVVLKGIKSNIYYDPDLSDTERKEVMALYNDIEDLIISDEYMDTLAVRWNKVEPRLMTMTSRAMLFSDLMEEGEYETILDMGFDKNDLMIDILRRSSKNYSDTFDETMLLIKAFIDMAAEALKAYDRRTLLSALYEYMNDETNFLLSKEDVNNAKYYAGIIDIGELIDESVLRLDILRDNLGEFKIVYDKKRINSLWNKENVYAYGIIRETDADFYMIVEPSKLYWRIHRGESVVQCYKVSADEKCFTHVPVEVRDGMLRVKNGWK